MTTKVLIFNLKTSEVALVDPFNIDGYLQANPDDTVFMANLDGIEVSPVSQGAAAAAAGVSALSSAIKFDVNIADDGSSVYIANNLAATDKTFIIAYSVRRVLRSDREESVAVDIGAARFETTDLGQGVTSVRVYVDDISDENLLQSWTV